MSTLIKDTLPLTQILNPDEAKYARNKNIPLFKGKLFKHEGELTENLDRYGRPIFNFVNENTVVIGGAVLALKKLFYGVTTDRETVDLNFMPKTLNEKYGVNANIVPPVDADAKSRIALFGCGIGGCGLEWGTAYDPDFKQDDLGEPETEWIPFRVHDKDILEADAAGNTPNNYFFRRPITIGTGKTGYAWYLKEFSNNPVPIRSLWQDSIDPSDDGSEIIGNTIDRTRDDLVECFGECVLTLTKEDLRSYYSNAGRLTNARFNQIGLFSGVKVKIVEPGAVSQESNYYDYINVRLFSVVNFDNVSVKEPTTNTYIYRIYAAV